MELLAGETGSLVNAPRNCKCRCSNSGYRIGGSLRIDCVNGKFVPYVILQTGNCIGSGVGGSRCFLDGRLGIAVFEPSDPVAGRSALGLGPGQIEDLIVKGNNQILYREPGGRRFSRNGNVSGNEVSIQGLNLEGVFAAVLKTGYNLGSGASRIFLDAF